MEHCSSPYKSSYDDMSKRPLESEEQRVCEEYAMQLQRGGWIGTQDLQKAQGKFFDLCCNASIPYSAYREFDTSIQGSSRSTVTAQTLLDFLQHRDTQIRPLLPSNAKGLLWSSHESGPYLAPFKLVIYSSGNDRKSREIWYQYDYDDTFYRSCHVPQNRTEILITRRCRLFVWDGPPEENATMSFHFEMGKATLTPYVDLSKSGSPILLSRPEVIIGDIGSPTMERHGPPLEKPQNIILRDVKYLRAQKVLVMDPFSLLKEHMMLSLQSGTWYLRTSGPCKWNQTLYKDATSIALTDKDVLEVVCNASNGQRCVFVKYIFSWQPEYDFGMESEFAAELEQQLCRDNPSKQEEDASSDEAAC